MGKAKFSDEVKRDAVRQITGRGYPVSEVSQRLGVSAHSLSEWRKRYAVPVDKSDKLAEKIRRLKRELVRVTEERDILKSGRVLRQGCTVRYAFVAEHREQFSVRTMCRCPRIHPSGFYAWLKNPLSKRAQEDICQARLIEDAWKQSGKVYGYCKLHDDLLDQGETSCANRIARLAKLAGIKAQTGYRQRPGSSGGKPSVVIDNTLNRQFDLDAPDTARMTDITISKTMEALPISPFSSPCSRAGLSAGHCRAG